MFTVGGRGPRRAFVSLFLHITFIFCLALLVDTAEAKKKKSKGAGGGMGGSRKSFQSVFDLLFSFLAFGQSKV